MRAMMALACGRWISSCASERATTAMSAAMPHSMALSALGAAKAAALIPPRSITPILAANSVFITSLQEWDTPPGMSRETKPLLLLLLARLVADAAGARAALRAARADRAAHAAGRARPAAGAKAVELALRNASVVVLVELAEAAAPGHLACFVARDVAVAVTVYRAEATRGCAGR